MPEQTGDNAKPFGGFYSPRTTPVPDNFFDEVMPELSEAELKVLLYVFRRTFGFKKRSDNIALAQMVAGIRRKDGSVLDRGTGLSKASVTRALKSLVERGMLRKVKRSSDARGDLPSTFEPVMVTAVNNITDPVSQFETRGGLKSEHGGSQIETRGVSKLNKGGSQIETHKKQGHNKQFDNTVNGGGSLLRELPDLEQESGETGAVLSEILEQLPDGESSGRFYQLVARKIQPHVIRQALSEIRNDGARHPGRLFTHKMHQYALKRLSARVGQPASRTSSDE